MINKIIRLVVLKHSNLDNKKVSEVVQVILNTTVMELHDLETGVEVSANEDLVAEDCEQDADRAECGRDSGKNGHGRAPDGYTRGQMVLQIQQELSPESRR